MPTVALKAAWLWVWCGVVTFISIRSSYVLWQHWYRMAANQGDGSALVSLGFMYYDGTAVPKDRSEAAKLWKRALNIRPVPPGWQTWHTEVEYMLAHMYRDGDGVSQDYGEADRYLTRAAEGGKAEAQFNLGSLYAAGDGVKQDLEKAFEWTEKSAKRGFAQAQNELGRAYEQMKQDYNKAIEWYKKAAAQGYQIAQQNLERLYKNGGVPKKSTADDPLGDLDLDNLFTDEDTVGGDPFADLL